MIGRDDDYLRASHFDFNFVPQSGLFKKSLWNPHAARVADLHQLGFHKYIVITLFQSSTGVKKGTDYSVPRIYAVSQAEAWRRQSSLVMDQYAVTAPADS